MLQEELNERDVNIKFKNSIPEKLLLIYELYNK